MSTNYVKLIRYFMVIEMMMTLDLDTKSRRLALNKARLLKSLYSKPTYIRRSASGKGFHVKVHEIAKYSLKLRLLLRYWLGDDKRRVLYDVYRGERGICTDVLFTVKGDRYASEWVEVQ